jgi:predicted dinucleotide-binding enzyme
MEDAMKIGIIGSGVVAQTLGSKLIGLGHDLILGTRDPSKLDDKKMLGATLREWKSQFDGRAHVAKIATFKEAAAHGELLINATSGPISLEALKLAAADQVGAKVLLDVANELDFSKGMPPGVLSSQERCLAERLAAAFPNLKVVKSLNTISAPVMVDPKALGGGDHTVFVSGDDAGAKATVVGLLKSFGWTDVLDLGALSSARGPEMYLALWVRLYGATQTGQLNIKVVR